ncbi:MAG: 4-hydroxybutyrate--acetyl-CoA CoA transferase, partial [Dehalococcoidia bacterium]
MSNYDKEYSRKLITSQKAIEKIKNSSTIVLPPGPGAPLALMAAIADRARSGDLRDIKIYTLFPMEQAHKTYLSPDLCDCIQTYSWFATGADRSFIKVGLDYYVPNYYHQIPRLIRDFMQIDVTMTAVSPMDKAGYFTLGLSNDYTSTAARHCKKLIVEVNENMPRVFGDSLIHVSEVDAIIENTGPLPVVVPADPMPEDDIIGKFVIEMVPDGATIQLGWGNIPNTIARYLTNHKDLGIHTELLGPGIIDLIKKGVVTGRKKNLHPRKSVFTNAIGTQSMYEFMNDNPGIESYPVSYINNPD